MNATPTDIERAAFDRAMREVEEMREQVRELKLLVEQFVGIQPDRPKLELVAGNTKRGS